MKKKVRNRHKKSSPAGNYLQQTYSVSMKMGEQRRELFIGCVRQMELRTLRKQTSERKLRDIVRRRREDGLDNEVTDLASANSCKQWCPLLVITPQTSRIPHTFSHFSETILR